MNSAEKRGGGAYGKSESSRWELKGFRVWVFSSPRGFSASKCAVVLVVFILSSLTAGKLSIYEAICTPPIFSPTLPPHEEQNIPQAPPPKKKTQQNMYIYIYIYIFIYQ